MNAVYKNLLMPEVIDRSRSNLFPLNITFYAFMHPPRISNPQTALKLLGMYVHHTSMLLLFIGTSLLHFYHPAWFYLLNIVSLGCNIILAEIHMRDVILTSHLESLLKKCKSQLSARGMNQSDKNVYRGSLISSYENLSVEPLLGL